MNIEMTKSYSSWEKVKIARHKDRPNSVFYIKNIFLINYIYFQLHFYNVHKNDYK